MLLLISLIPTILALSPHEADLSSPSHYTAFTTPIFTSAQAFSTASPLLPNPNLLRRQTIGFTASASGSGSCPASYLPCSGSGAGACCRQGTVCSNDAANHIACCPTSAVCTGTINVGSQAASSGAQSTPASSGSSGFLAPASQSASAAAVVPASTISNQYYAFAVLPTSFSNAAACSSGYTSCASEYQKCTNALGGNANALTVAGGNGAGVTVPGATVSLGPSATQVCASLSQQACHNLQLASCTAFGGASGFTNPNAAPTRAPGLRVGAVGVMVGLLGQAL